MNDYITWLRNKIGHKPAILVGVSAVIYNDKEEILLIKRGDNGEWAFPGGIMEPGESARETLTREIREELGGDVMITDFLGVYTNRGALKYPNGDIAYIVGIFFLCKIREALKIDGNEALEARFFDRLSLPTPLFHMHKQPITDFFEGLRGVIK
ncbi:MAG: NUDIX domain-containing protein [Candidatus Uhrbacteria bacterium]|nr:NUDIX domain-containing protein [Candidatus Uhrbacteria bacterium]